MGLPSYAVVAGVVVVKAICWPTTASWAGGVDPSVVLIVWPFHWIWLPRICVLTETAPPFELLPTVIAAFPVGSLAPGSTVNVICVGLTTVTLVSDALLPLATFAATGVTGQDAVALAEVVKPVPVMVTG